MVDNINIPETASLKINNETVLSNTDYIDENNVVFSCGSGITASVLGLAYSMINDKYLPTVYDGSWVEYGKIK